MLIVSFLTAILAGAPPAVELEPEHWSERPIVIAHRGASGLRPEHTRAAYLLAIENGADYIEPDIVMSGDGMLVVRHDVYLSTSTDIGDRQEFAGRVRELDGRKDWYSFDFSWQELQELKARQAYSGRTTDYDDRTGLLRFADVVDIAIASKRAGRTVGLYPEVKHPARFMAAGLDPTPAFVAEVERAAAAGVPVYIQCFDLGYLTMLATRTTVPLIYLVEDAQSLDLATLPVAIQGIGAARELIVDKGNLLPLGKAIKDKGLALHVWTVRDDNVGPGFGSVQEELDALYDAGVDGVFTDFPATAVRVRDRRRLILPPLGIELDREDEAQP